MNAVSSATRTHYSGCYRHGVDNKRRVQVPARWRPAEGGVEFTLIAWPKEAAGVCLRALPPEGMAKLMQMIDEIPNTDPNKTVLKRLIGSNSEQVPLDKAGRICVPEEMARAAGIKDHSVLVGCLDHFQLWSPERHEQLQMSDGVHTSEAFKFLP